MKNLDQEFGNKVSDMFSNLTDKYQDVLPSVEVKQDDVDDIEEEKVEDVEIGEEVNVGVVFHPVDVSQLLAALDVHVIHLEGLVQSCSQVGFVG